MKGTAIFGGVQVFNILINIIRGKFIAIFLGPVGMGVSALLSSTVNTISQFSGLGLGLGAMRDISMAHQSNDTQKLSQVAKVFRRIIFITGVIGALITILGAGIWSDIAFGSDEHTVTFMLLGLMVFFTALAGGETTLLQGTRHLRYLANTSLFGSFIGLVVGIPMYYFWGVNGIAPAMIALAIATYVSNRFFSKKIELFPAKVTPKQTFVEAKQMIALGIILTITTLLGTLAIYLNNWFIRSYGSVEDVGLYQAATSITTQYIGFIFAAMSVDYFPRLAAISNDNSAVTKNVNQQAEIVTLIATPIIIALIATTPVIVRLLLTEEFYSTIPLLRWLGLSLFFKAASYAVGYISFAKGDKKTFLLLEGVFGNVFIIIFTVIGYLLWGLIGLGVAVLTSYILYFFIISIIARWRYQFKFQKEFVKLFISLLPFCLFSFLLSLFFDETWIIVIIQTIIFFSAAWYCYLELNKRMNIKELLMSKFSKK